MPGGESFTEQGRASEDQGDLSEAEVLFERAIEQGSPARADLGAVLRKQGKLDQARVVLMEGLSVGETNVAFEYALLCEEMGDVASAIEMYAKAVQEGERNAHLNLAIVLDEQEQIEDAQMHFEQAHETEDQQALGPYAEFVADRQPHGISRAIATLTHIVGKAMGSEQESRVRRCLAQLLLDSGQPDDALIELQRLVKAGDHTALYSIADIYIEREEFADAVDAYETLIKNGEPAYGPFGALLLSMNRQSDAIAVLDEGVEHADSHTLVFRAGLFLEEDDSREAVRLFREAARLGAVDVHNVLASIHEELGEDDEAEREYRLALAEGDEEARPDFVSFLSDRGRNVEADIIESMGTEPPPT